MLSTSTEPVSYSLQSVVDKRTPSVDLRIAASDHRGAGYSSRALIAIPSPNFC